MFFFSITAILYNATERYSTAYYVLGGWLGLTALTYIPTYRMLQARAFKNIHTPMRDQEKGNETEL